MKFIIRPANPSDLQPMYEMAKRTGGGFTNLPPDRKALTAKLERSAEGFARVGGRDLGGFLRHNFAHAVHADQQHVGPAFVSPAHGTRLHQFAGLALGLAAGPLTGAASLGGGGAHRTNPSSVLREYSHAGIRNMRAGAFV